MCSAWLYAGLFGSKTNCVQNNLCLNIPNSDCRFSTSSAVPAFMDCGRCPDVWAEWTFVVIWHSLGSALQWFTQSIIYPKHILHLSKWVPSAWGGKGLAFAYTASITACTKMYSFGVILFINIGHMMKPWSILKHFTTYCC